MRVEIGGLLMSEGQAARTVKRMTQLDWAIDMITQYLKDHEPAGVRRFHYWIVSKPEEERMIPAKVGVRLYENTRQEYQRLDQLLTKARIKGLIPFS